MQNLKQLKTHLISFGILLLASSMTPQSFAKEFYKWVDSNGSTHYSANPPPKNARHKTKVETYGHNVSGSTSSATPVDTPPTTPPQNTTPSQVEAPKADQQSEANAALQKGQLERAPQ
ncbi:DUF4124 domain-containing protein [Acinetobacter defluvii]|uniref:DUF4124 domain-containing protein n=1 Tax=Acinetobacter defluvii TaxID=1871111 RepID=UPI003AF7DF26